MEYPEGLQLSVLAMPPTRCERRLITPAAVNRRTPLSPATLRFHAPDFFTPAAVNRHTSQSIYVAFDAESVSESLAPYGPEGEMQPRSQRD